MSDDSIYPLACRYPEDKPCLHLFTEMPFSGGNSRAGNTMPKRKHRVDIAAALEAHDRAQAASDEIRCRAELDPLPANGVIAEWRSKPPPKASRASAAESPLEEIAKAAAARKRAETRIARAVRQAKEAGVSVADVASQLGMTRQGVYAMLARS
jgi:hypothetical protein